ADPRRQAALCAPGRAARGDGADHARAHPRSRSEAGRRLRGAGARDLALRTRSDRLHPTQGADRAAARRQPALEGCGRRPQARDRGRPDDPGAALRQGPGPPLSPGQTGLGAGGGRRGLEPRDRSLRTLLGGDDAHHPLHLPRRAPPQGSAAAPRLCQFARRLGPRRGAGRRTDDPGSDDGRGTCGGSSADPPLWRARTVAVEGGGRDRSQRLSSGGPLRPGRRPLRGDREARPLRLADRKEPAMSRARILACAASLLCAGLAAAWADGPNCQTAKPLKPGDLQVWPVHERLANDTPGETRSSLMNDFGEFQDNSSGVYVHTGLDIRGVWNGGTNEGDLVLVAATGDVWAVPQFSGDFCNSDNLCRVYVKSTDRRHIYYYAHLNVRTDADSDVRARLEEASMNDPASNLPVGSNQVTAGQKLAGLGSFDGGGHTHLHFAIFDVCENYDGLNPLVLLPAPDFNGKPYFDTTKPTIGPI